jgi:septal ring factor EnvC (AmiA/AmiB activator)
MMRATTILLLAALVACTESHGASVSDSAAGEAFVLRMRNAALDESLRVVRSVTERQNIEKDLLVREVHSFDYFMEQLQDEFRRIRTLQRQAGSLDPREDPLSSVESERSQILREAKAARVRLSRLEAAAEQQGRQLSALRDSVRASADSALASGSERDSSRTALASVRVLVADLRMRLDDLQHQVDSLTTYSRELHDENERLTAVIAANAARDSTVYYVVATRKQLLDWRLARETGGVPVTGWGRVLQPNEIRDSTHFTVGHMRTRVIKLDESRDYQLLTSQSTSALETRIAPDGTFHGSLHIHDSDAFWRASKWMIIVAR